MSSSSKNNNAAAAAAAASRSSPPKKYIRGKYGKLILNPEHTVYMKQQHLQQQEQQQTKTSILKKNSSSSCNMDNSNITTNPLLHENESLAASPKITTQDSKDDNTEEWIPIIDDDNQNHQNNDDDDNMNTNRTSDVMDDSTDPISLAYLAQLSREVYNFDGTATLVTPETATATNTDTPENDSYLNSDAHNTDGGGVATTDITTDMTTTTNDNEHDNQGALVTVGNNNTNTSSSEKKKSRNEIIQIGPDQFSIYEVFLEQNKKNETATSTNDSTNNPENTTAEVEAEEEDQTRNHNKKKKTLIVAIAGTFSPMQHLMNIMPHAYQGLYTAQEFWCGGSSGPSSSSNAATTTNTNTAIAESMRTLTTNNYPTTTKKKNEKTDTHPENANSAYRNGHVHGWEEPAENIYEELMRRLVHTNTNANEDAPTPIIANNHTTSLYDVYDRILLTGHSRGGLLAYYVGLHILQSTANTNNTSENPRRHVLRVIGFGMPPPLQEIPNEDRTTRQYVQHNVVSVFNRNDPVANNTLPTFVDTHNWKPIVVDIGAKTKHKAPPKIQPPTPAATSRNSKSSSSSFWNLLGNVVTAAVTVVADKATELKYDLEQNHTIHQYVKLMTLDTNDTENSSSSSSKNSSNTTSRMDGSSDSSSSSSVDGGVVSTTAASSSSSSSIIITDDRNQNVYLLPSSGVVILGRDSNEHDDDIDSQYNTSHNEYSKTRRNRRQLQLLLPSV